MMKKNNLYFFCFPMLPPSISNMEMKNEIPLFFSEYTKIDRIKWNPI